MSHDQTSYPLPPGFLGMGNLSFSPLKKKKNKPQQLPLLFFLYIPTLRTLVTLASGGCGCMNHVWKSNWASAKETDRLGSLSLNLYTWST